MHAQILQQKNSMLEEQLEWVTNTFEELKKEAIGSASMMNSSISESDGQFLPHTDSFESGDSLIEFEPKQWRSYSLDQVSNWRRRKSTTSIHPGTVRSKSFVESPKSPALFLNRRKSDTSESALESSFSPAFECDHSPETGAEVCQHFLKGRCRYKSLCKYSHDIAQCPYCKGELPMAKIAASTHLSRCYKAHTNS